MYFLMNHHDIQRNEVTNHNSKKKTKIMRGSRDFEVFNISIFEMAIFRVIIYKLEIMKVL